MSRCPNCGEVAEYELVEDEEGLAASGESDGSVLCACEACGDVHAVEDREA